MVSYFTLDTAEDMASALNALLAIEFYGSITTEKDVVGAVKWRIQASSQNQPGGVGATLGEVLIWDGQALSSISGAEFQAQYTPQ